MNDQQWARAIMERDSWTCQNCGTTKNLDAAHIIGKHVNPTLRHDMANGVTLCRNCHVWYHQSPQMWERFVTQWRQSGPICNSYGQLDNR